MLVVRCFSIITMSTGLTFMMFVEDIELLVWGAWPCIAIGGICSHLSNVKMTLATPTFRGTLLSVLAGALGAGGSVGLIMQNIMNNYELNLYDVFLYWLIAYLVLSSLKLFIWTPVHMPLITHDDEYSIYTNSALVLQCTG